MRYDICISLGAKGLQMEPIGCPETWAKSDHYARRNLQEERRFR